jgi:hypothetical protein
MTAWTSDELTRIGGAEELQLASVRPDGTLRPYVTMWAVRTGDDLYVRSAYGPTNPWFRRAKASGAGRIRAAVTHKTIPLRPHKTKVISPIWYHLAQVVMYHSVPQ